MKSFFFHRKHIHLCIGLLITLFASCDKYLLVDPPIDKITTGLVFDNDDAVKSAITGIYSRMAENIITNNISSVASITGMSADEFINYNPDYDSYYLNSQVAGGNTNPQWSAPYQYIYTANAILEGLGNANSVSVSVKTQVEGEAKFIRAFNYFYLTNLFGDIPLHLTTDYRTNSTATKSKQSKVYEQIIKDLLEAQNLLTPTYYTTDRVRPNKWAATAMLSRTYLYIRDWDKAETEATKLLVNNPIFKLKDDLNDVFLKNSTESIWQLKPNSAGLITNEANLFILTGLPTAVSISQNLVDAFQSSDKRRTSWVGTLTVSGKTYYYPYKYKIRTATGGAEDSMMLRLAEQYLIRAEARINLNKIELGIEDLNVLRKRARATATTDNPDPLPALSKDLSKPDALLAVEQERRIELFSEWGHRWLDLKRTNRADAILKPIKGSSWQSSDVLYPIPQTEIDANPLIIQNDGY